MSVFSIILFLAMIGVLIVVRKNKAFLPIAGVLAGVVILIALTNLWRSASGSGTEYSGTFEEAAGRYLGQQIARDHAGGGKVVVIQYQSEIKHIADVSQHQLQGVEMPLKRGAYSLVSVGPTFVFPEGEDGWIDTTGGFAAKQFLEWLAPHKDAVAVVSFLGFPMDAKRNTFNVDAPLYVCSSGSGELLQKAVDAGLIRSLIAYKSGINPTLDPGGGATDEEILDMRFERIEHK